MILSKGGPRWNEFIDRLAGPEGCNFNDEGKWECGSDSSKPLARKVLAAMGDVDVEGTLAGMPDYYCDCEILFNLCEEAEH